MKYYYFVSFACEHDGKGSISFITTGKIRIEEDIESIRQSIRDKYNIKEVTIMNIVLLDSEKDDNK